MWGNARKKLELQEARTYRGKNDHNDDQRAIQIRRIHLEKSTLTHTFTLTQYSNMSSSEVAGEQTETIKPVQVLYCAGG